MTAPLKVVVVSDATGATAEAVVTAALVQFPDSAWTTRRVSFVRKVEQIEELVEELTHTRSIIVFTFVDRDLGETIVEAARQKGIEAYDVMRTPLKVFSEVLDQEPTRVPGVFRRQSENMFRVAEYIDFAVKHDNRRDGEGLQEADVILLGLSGTGKTPTSVYLSCQKIKVATVAIVMDVPIPEQVSEVAAPKVGLRMDFDRRLQLSSAHAQRKNPDVPWFADREKVAAELDYCNRIFRSIPGIQVIDVAYRSVEEVSDWIIRRVM